MTHSFCSAQFDIHKIRLQTTELKDKLVVETGHRISGDKDLNKELLEEVGVRKAEVDRVEVKVDNEVSERKEAIETEMVERIKMDDVEAEERKEEVVRVERERKAEEEREEGERKAGEERLDERIDGILEMEEKLSDKVDSNDAYIRSYVKVVEAAAADALRREGARRKEEDEEIREEEKCRNGAENCLRFVVDKVDEEVNGTNTALREKQIQEIRAAETARVNAEFLDVTKREGEEMMRVDGQLMDMKRGVDKEVAEMNELLEKVGKDVKDDQDKLASKVEDDLRTAVEGMRMAGESEHREIVQLIADETGAVRKDVENMLGDVETAVKGAEGSVIKLDEKTKGELEVIRENVEVEVKKVREEVAQEAAVRGEEMKEEMKKEVEVIVEAANVKGAESREEEVRKVARSMIEDNMIEVGRKIEEKTKAIDWDALKNKAGVNKAKGGSEPEEEGKE